MNIHNYGKQLLAEFDPPAKPIAPQDTPAIAPTKTQAILDLTLTSLHIDPHQPRQFLPDALRRQLTHATHSASEVLMQLMSSAAQMDSRPKSSASAFISMSRAQRPRSSLPNPNDQSSGQMTPSSDSASVTGLPPQPPHQQYACYRQPNAIACPHTGCAPP